MGSELVFILWGLWRISIFTGFFKWLCFLSHLQLGNFIHYMATFVSGFIVGFTAVWQLALVTLAVVPLIAVIGGIHTTTLSKLSAKSQQALSQAGNIAEQVKILLLTMSGEFIFVTNFERNCRQ